MFKFITETLGAFNITIIAFNAYKFEMKMNFRFTGCESDILRMGKVNSGS